MSTTAALKEVLTHKNVRKVGLPLLVHQAGGEGGGGPWGGSGPGDWVSLSESRPGVYLP